MAFAAPVLTGLAIAGTVVSAGGSILQGVAAKRAAEFRAGIAEMNRRVAEINAERSLQRGQIEAQEFDMESLAFLGTQLATQGASGVSVSSGSHASARKAARTLARIDARRIVENSRVEAFQHRVTGAGLEAEATLARREGRQSLLAGFINAGSSLITGASRVAGIRGGL